LTSEGTQQAETESLPCSKLYSKLAARKILFFLVCLVVLVILVPVSASFGSVHLEVNDVFHAIIARIFPFSGVKSSELASVIVWRLRLRWVTMAMVAGAGLSICGAVMQGALQNPLVSPFTLGVSSGATLGASLAIILGIGFVGSGRYFIVANSFVFSMITSLLIIGFGRLRGTTPEAFILVGIALTYSFSAITSFLQYFAEEGDLMAVAHWIFGSVMRASWEDIMLVSATMLICLPLLMKFSWDLNAMTLGDEVAISLGVNPARVRIACMILVALVTASITSFTGIIGFVGLVAPHVARLVIGGDYRLLIPCSCVLGAIMVVTANIIGRSIMPPTVLPVGIVMSSIGGPFFLYLLLKKRRRYWK